MDINANLFQVNNKSQSFYKQSREPGSPNIFTSTISNRNSNVRIIRNIKADSDLSKEKLLKNEEIDALNDNGKKDNLYLKFTNPNFNNIKCKYKNYIIYIFSPYAI